MDKFIAVQVSTRNGLGHSTVNNSSIQASHNVYSNSEACWHVGLLSVYSDR